MLNSNHHYPQRVRTTPSHILCETHNFKYIVCVCIPILSEDLHIPTHRHTEDSKPSEDPNTGSRKTLARNAENVISTPRSSMDFKYYYIFEDTRVLESICNSRVTVCVCGGGEGWGVWVCVWG